ncbi:hypothetical protein [Inquilinus limosus]|uniref:Uncharacterized protein n=1 Tax=Inquilinus limosus TaxID=171674 RepID=A0A211ZR93_9PROT|nr:hypothetical protein [Inquilinus limosus]OWJ67802.1 hypothetical protein BWR60_07425 [Inquilinus limosus]
MTDGLIHIHEDDWGMRNLYPAAAEDEAQNDMARATEADERNRAPDGQGWTDMHVIQPPKTDFAAAGLQLAAVVAALEPLMPRVRRFYAAIGSAMARDAGRDPLGSYEEDAVCFGFGRSCFVKVEPKGDLVARVWFEASGPEPAQLAALRAALLAIDSLSPSIVADYWLDETGRVGDAAFLDRYFAALEGAAS